MNGKSIALHGIVLLFIVALVGCTGNVTVQPTGTLTALPSPLPTIELTQSPTAVSSPTPVFVDSRETLSPGMYAVYWNKDTWYIKGLGESDSRILIPSAISDLYTEMELSPDGNLVAYSEAGGRILIYDFRTSQIKSFVNPKVTQIMEIVWARDGKTLYYLGTRETVWIPDSNLGLYGISFNRDKTYSIIDWDNSKFRHDGLHGLALSENGRWLTFYAPTMSEMMAPDPKYAIYIMDTNCTNDPMSCINSTDMIGDGDMPDWSPDGKLSWVCSSNALCKADADSIQSTKQVFLTTDDLGTKMDAVLFHYLWSPDGRYLAVTVENPKSAYENVSSEVFFYSFDEKRSIKISNTPNQLDYVMGWSPDSRYLAFERNVGYTEFVDDLGIRFVEYDIYIYDVVTGQIVDQIESAGNRQEFMFFMSIE